MSADPATADLAWRTLRIGVESVLLAALLGVPLGVVLGLGRFRGRRGVLGLFNAGLRVPPVAVGHGLWLLMWPSSAAGPGLLADLGWLYTLNAVILAQGLLALPILVALTAAAMQAVDGGLLDQARSFGAGRAAVARLALREARFGLLAAVIAALGTAMASVGAVLIVSGPATAGATLPAQSVSVFTQGDRDAEAVAYGSVMLGMFLALAAALTLVQRGGRWRAS